MQKIEPTYLSLTSCLFLLVQPETSVKKRQTLGTAEAEFNFFKDPRSHGAPKGYTLHSTEVNIKYLIVCFQF